MALKLIAKGANCDIKDKNQLTILMKAVNLQKVDLLDAILSRQTNINDVDLAGNTALHMAVKQNWKIGIEKLILGGARTKILNGMKKKPIDIAIDENKRDLVQLIEETRLQLKFDPIIKKNLGNFTNTISNIEQRLLALEEQQSKLFGMKGIEVQSQGQKQSVETRLKDCEKKLSELEDNVSKILQGGSLSSDKQEK